MKVWSKKKRLSMQRYWTPYRREQWRKRHSGKGNPRYGQHCSIETKEKIRMANLGRYPSVETRRKMGLSHKGFRHSKKTKKLLSKQHSGKGNPFYGMHHSETTRRKMHIAAKFKLPISDKQRKKRSLAVRGKKHPMWGRNHSYLSRLFMSISHRGRKNYWYGKSRSDEANRRLSRSLKKYNREHYEIVLERGRRAAHTALRKRREHFPYRFNGVGFDSASERMVAKLLVKHWHVKLIERKNCHVFLGGREFDFVVKGYAIEFHPINNFFWPKETESSYRRQRLRALRAAKSSLKLVVLFDLRKAERFILSLS